MKEKWLPVVGFEGRYEVSDLGRVKSLRFRSNGGVKVMKSTPNHAKYNVVTLGAERKQFRVAVLVLEAFIGPRPGSKLEYDACHGNLGNTIDYLSNLRWDTRRGNCADRSDSSGERNSNSKLSDLQVKEIKFKRSNNYEVKNLAKEYGITVQRIYQLTNQGEK